MARYEYYITGDDSNDPIGTASVNKGCQTFTPSLSHTIGSAKFKLWRVGSPGTLTLELFATTAGIPTGSALASGTFNGNTVTTSSPGVWYEIEFDTSYTLTASTMYALVLSVNSGSASNYINMRVDSSSATYAGGTMVEGYGTPPTQQWYIWAAYDYMFEEWGTTEATGSKIYPTDPTTRVTSIIHRYDRGVYNTELLFGDIISDFSIPNVDSTTTKTYQSKEELEKIYKSFSREIPDSAPTQPSSTPISIPEALVKSPITQGLLENPFIEAIRKTSEMVTPWDEEQGESFPTWWKRTFGGGQ